MDITLLCPRAVGGRKAFPYCTGARSASFATSMAILASVSSAGSVAWSAGDSSYRLTATGCVEPALITTSKDHGRAVIEAIERQLGELATEPIAGPAWPDYGSVTVANSREVAATLMDNLAPEHSRSRR